MSSAGRILIAAYTNDASSANIPASGSSALQLDSALASDVTGATIVNSIAADVNLYEGPAGGEKLLMVIPGRTSTVLTLQQFAILINKGVRLSLRAVANSAISSGILTINLWG